MGMRSTKAKGSSTSKASSSSTGTVVSVQAGTNVTVDNTDPANPIVNADDQREIQVFDIWITNAGSSFPTHSGLTMDKAVETLDDAFSAATLLFAPSPTRLVNIQCLDNSIFEGGAHLQCPPYMSIIAPLATINAGLFDLNSKCNLVLNKYVSDLSGPDAGINVRAESPAYAGKYRVDVNEAEVEGRFFKNERHADVFLNFDKVTTQGDADDVIVNDEPNGKTVLSKGKIFARHDALAYDIIGIHALQGEIIGECSEIIFIQGPVPGETTGTAVKGQGIKVDLRIGRTYTNIGIHQTNDCIINAVISEFLPHSNHVIAEGLGEVNVICGGYNPTANLWGGNPAAKVNIRSSKGVQLLESDGVLKELQNIIATGPGITKSIITDPTFGKQILLETAGAAGGARVDDYKVSLGSQLTFISGSTQGALQFVVVLPEQSVEVSSMICYLTQVAGASRGRMGIYTQVPGVQQYDKIAETANIDFSFGVGTKSASLLAPVTLIKNQVYFLALSSIGNPQFLAYNGAQTNSPNALTWRTSNIWASPVPDPVPVLPTPVLAGSTDNTRFWISAF